VALPPAAPEQAADEAADRAAIAEVDGGEDSAHWKVAKRAVHAAHLHGLQKAASQRPPFWPGAERVPTPGAWCSRCAGAGWWREHDAGWRCVTCQPISSHSAAEVTKVGT
jgi:hypothetical protein